MTVLRPAGALLRVSLAAVLANSTWFSATRARDPRGA
jgi:hypothetical protein